MNKFRGVHYLLCVALLLGVLGGTFGGQVVLAAQESSGDSFLLPPSQDEPPPEEPKEEVELSAQWPTLQSTAGSSLEYEITFNYHIKERRTFDLNLTVPPGWTGVTKANYPKVEIEAFEPEPRQLTDKLLVEVEPVAGNLLEPGEYVFTLEAASGDLKDSVDLKAVITEEPPSYQLSLVTPTLQTEVQLKAGENNHASVLLINPETGLLKNITLSSEKPEGWSIAFTPSKIESLESGLTQEIDVAIIPPNNTEAGDYPIILKATSEKTDTDLELRATVLTSTVWGGVGIGIAVGVIAGLIVWFRRLGRR